ncbi:hypothetical protein BKA04_001049 [Cryobacterium mesophilum]|uniref:HNH endonuclease n=1 Tax=Terrimesophilobacter mesophilus TaxID=433647 RepID=A0A4R8VC34_9MICO|nr:HNH endonuclease signature motif containing protein [Terrimesophilobacter mesophilus]MBB5632826.1 hypothetical protein [Terrimesophilobacter mesophilus]TFB79612.1 HNH endonuclease [Terrimesophilobacter mesophilus]
MSTSANIFTSSLEVLADAAARAGENAPGSRALDDAGLLAAQRALAEVKRHVDACAAVLAGETVRRSCAEAGLDGLARKQGFRTPEALIRGITGSSSREAGTLVRVGSMLNDADLLGQARANGVDDPEEAFRIASKPWLAVVGAAVASGSLSIAAAEALRNGLGEPGPGIDREVLAAAAARLVDMIASWTSSAGAGAALSRVTIDADRVLRLARDARDELDAAGIAERERQRRSLRAFRRWRRPDGMTRYTWDLDPEGAALIDDVYDKITSPRRRGPRFIAEGERERAEAIERDERTMEQLASDSLLELVQLALDTDPTTIVGLNRPAVRILVAAKDLESGSGRGWIEGQDLPVSIATVERHLCSAGSETIAFDDRMQPANLGRTARYFNRVQRRLLSARDGGCRWPGCERPPEWTEAHHVRWWDRDHGPTDVDNGILLCRHHHLLLHDNHWEIELTTRGGPPGIAGAGECEYWLIPPSDVDPARTRRSMPTKSPALRDALGGALRTPTLLPA